MNIDIVFVLLRNILQLLAASLRSRVVVTGGQDTTSPHLRNPPLLLASETRA
jgi:hypothetical protein